MGLGIMGRTYPLCLLLGRERGSTQANIDAILEYAQEAVQAQSVSELVELSTTHSRRQLEMMGEQAREIASAAQKLATESTRPFTGGLGNQLRQMS